VLGGPLSESLSPVAWRPELDEAAVRLLEVVTEDLVELDQINVALLEPICEAFVQVGSNGFGQCVVRRVADQEMAEAVRLLPGELRSVGPDELLAHECDESWRLGLAVSEGLHGALMENVALDRAALEDSALCRVKLVEASGEERLDIGGHADFVIP
jgi:hypothetical protein